MPILAAAFLAIIASTFAATEKATADSARITTALSPSGGRITVEAEGVQPPAPLFFSVAAEETVQVHPAEITAEIKLKIHIVQGRPERLSLGLVGEGEVADVTGAGLRDWSVRQGVGPTSRRFLDLQLVLPDGQEGPRGFDLTVHTRRRDPVVPGQTSILLVAPGEAVGFDLRLRLQPDPAIDLRLMAAAGLTVVGENKSPGAPTDWVAQGDAFLTLALARRGAGPTDVELTAVQLTGEVNEAARSVEFLLRGVALVEQAGARLRVLAGGAALSARAAGDGWHAELVPADGGDACEVVFERKGLVPVELGFAAAIGEDGDWRRVAFQMPAGTVVPVHLSGLGDGVEFDPRAPVVLAAAPAGWQGFLPADGGVSLAWKRTREKVQAALFFTSTELSEVRVGAGLVRQTSSIAFRTLQGKLNQIRMKVEGPGEIVGVEGEGSSVLGWNVAEAAGARTLAVKLSRPIEGEGTIVVRSQAVLGGFPVRVEPLRLTPEGGVRHAGFVRVANSGAVRLEVVDAEGMMQLAPAQFPGAAPEDGARQVFVYRFPSAARNYRILASQIQPEVGVSEVVTYELGETERVIAADVELEVREAPLHDWTFAVPEDYSVVTVQGAEVADYAVDSTGSGGLRPVKVIFNQPAEGRLLLRLRLEKNQAAAPGEWKLPPLAFPAAKSVRGHIGVVAAPGFRLVPAETQQLSDVPLAYFPRQTAGLQQAFRLRDAGWSAAVRVEALGQSVQADVFHLYSLREGAVAVSVLVNYFVVGAPAGEWRLAVPAAAGNIDVIGQGVRRDWRREGNELIVTLHQPVLGAATLLVTFEEPLGASGGTISPGEVRPLGVQAERGYLQVVSPRQVKSAIRRAEGGLLKLEPLELPAEFRLFASSPSLAVYQYTARPFALELGIEGYQPAETVEQVVDFARFTSQVSRDGQVVTDARFFVKTRGRKALRLQLPAGMKLWEARVEGEVITARADGEATLIPLAPRLNPNEPVQVALRLGQAAGSPAGLVQLTAPRAAAPMMIGEWTLRADPGRYLVPRGGTATLARPNLAETGFEWIANRARVDVIVVLLLAGLGALALRTGESRWVPSGLLAGAVAVVIALHLAWNAAGNQRPNSSEVTFAATSVPADAVVSIAVDNVPLWRALISWWGVAAAVAGGALLLVPRLRRARAAAIPRAWRLALACMLLAAGVLLQRAGAAWFFVALAGAVASGVLWPGIRLAWHGFGTSAQPVTAAVVPLLMLGFVMASASAAAPKARAESLADVRAAAPERVPAAQAMVQRWEIREGRLFAVLDVTIRGGPGESFLLLQSPAIVTDFSGAGLHLGKLGDGATAAYYVTPEREGTLVAQVKFELPVPDLAAGLPLLTGPAAMQRVTIVLDQPGWEFSSPRAVRVQPLVDAGEGRSGATLLLGGPGEPVIHVLPQQRNAATEAVQFFAEAANLFVPGPGVVNGTTRLTVRPVQGRVATLDLEVPPDFTVGEVSGGPVGAWRFDPEKRRLHVAVEPAQAGTFALIIETQRGAGALPFELTLQPLRVAGAAGEVGTLALAFGGDAQPEAVRATGMSAVSVADFDASLLPTGRDGQALATLQSAYRYSGAEGAATLRVAPVAPEVRVTGRQVVSLGDDRLVLAADLQVAITRVGLFKLSFALPAGLEVESASGPALSHWTEAEEGGQRVVTLQLNGRTLGEQAFALTLVGPVPAAQAGWRVPRIALREATRQTGELQLVPEKGLRLRALERTHVSELDARAAGNARPGVLAFRLLQADWDLTVAVAALEPWVTVQALQEVTLREGQTQTRIGLRYRIENAAVKQLGVRLPGLGAEEARTVRATGSAVSDLVPVPGETGRWEIHFQRGVIGETDVQIEFSGPSAPESGRETVATPVFDGVRQSVQFVALRGGGRLELEASDLPRGWQRADWSAVPVALQDRGDRSVPTLAFRVAEPARPLAVTVRRHEVADALKLRVAGGTLTTLLSAAGPAVTAVELQVEVVEKSTLRVRLPAGAQLFTALVNGENVPVVREGEAYFFHVVPGTAADRSATVRLVYAVLQAQAGNIALIAPGLSVPLENVAWRVVLPPGFRLADYRGGLRLRDERAGAGFGLEDYQTLVVAKRAADAQQASALLQEAGSLLQQGRQQLAGEVLSRVSNVKSLDAATNEDARVQLRALKTQQTVLGLNTRRQRLYLDNNGDAPRNEPLEQAARLNPFMKGKLDFDPAQLDQMLLGNTVEENTALQGIAGRMVDQQLAAEPAPAAIDVTLPERGQVLTFIRSLQVEGGTPLELQLSLATGRGPTLWFGAGLVLAAGLIAGLVPRRAA